MENKQHWHIGSLSNGLRTLCVNTPNSRAEYFGVIIPYGSRSEKPEHYGLAHFVEHTIFKGTLKRRAWHILNRMEVKGGELNAYTTKEETVVYSIFPSGNFERALELIADLIANSQFPQSELDKEREVVEDEINSYLDNPSEAIYDDYEDLLFQGSGLGHNILGNSESLKGFNSDTCRYWLNSRYVPERLVAFYNGGAEMDKVMRLMEKHLGGKFNSPEENSLLTKEDTPKMNPVFNIERQIPSHQCHCIIGSRIPGIFSDTRWSMALLNNILGGPGMNSLLNVSLREKRGLVYTVESSTAVYTDCGALTIYFGCDPSDLSKCVRLVRNQLDAMASTALTQQQLQRFTEQYIGQMTIASENREQQTLSLARSVLYFNSFLTDKELTERLRSITPEQLRQTAELISNPSILTFSTEKD